MNANERLDLMIIMMLNHLMKIGRLKTNSENQKLIINNQNKNKNKLLNNKNKN